ncbi:MAG: tetratricopeptide repeat protein [Pyrinomonadaceae bacterium]
MKKLFLTVPLAALLCAQGGAARQQPATQPTPARTHAPAQPPQRPAPAVASLGLSDYGIEIVPDARLVVMMAALDAAGWDPTHAGERPSVYRELIRKEQSGLDAALRQRLQDFYARNALKDVADNPATPENEAAHYTPADQAARYISLAYTLGQPPAFEAPARSDDLPSGVLEVLDFVPLLREFYKQSGMDARLPNYLNMHRAAGDKLRAQTLDMARVVLAYLNTRPETIINERVTVPAPSSSQSKKKQGQTRTVLREHVRHFRVVPDLLAASGAVNLRAVGDDYFVIVPPDATLILGEARRAYLQFVVDPLVARFSREVAARRPEIKQLLEAEQARRGRTFGPDIFLTVARSLVAAADARLDEIVRLRALQLETSRRLQSAADQAAKDAALKESKERETAIRESTTAQLAEAYERGAVLAFHFADQLRGFEGGGFDVANYMPDMVAAFNVERELKRPAEYAAVVARVRARRATLAVAVEPTETQPTDERRTALIKSLNDVSELLRLRNYEEADVRLAALRNEYANEPLIYFTLGQAASLAAQEAIDEALQAERLNAALGHFRQAILFSTPDTDPSLVPRAHLSSGRILAHLERREEALREFDAVISTTKPTDRFYQEALAEKKKLGQ